MRSYLSLITISAKANRRRNRMTLFCIILAVFLVTAVFSMADMGIRMEKNRAIENHGNWHIMLKNISADQAERIGSRSDVAAASWYDVINYRIDEDYYIDGKKAAVCGVEKAYMTDILDCITEGSFPENENEAILTDNAKDIMGINVGDSVTLNTPSGDIEYTVSGFTDESSSRLYDAFVIITDITSFNKRFGATGTDNVYYVQFGEHTNVRRAISEIKEEYGLTDDNVSENTALLGVTGFSSSSYVMGLYMIAGVLFVMILTAGVFMIAGSINSGVAERTQFFGMMRCIGASKRQIVRFVRLEALRWCKTAVPIGVALGIAITWILCATLRFGIGGEFVDIPIFEVSWIGIVCGVIVGLLSVLIAAQSPARRAAKTSPAAAASGNSGDVKEVRHGARARFFKIETALGIHHAISAKKNLILMTGSFALSIILFLSFSVILDWTQSALQPLRPYAPDLSILSEDRSCAVDRSLIAEISESPGVKRVFGRMFMGDVPASSDRGVDKIDLISYEDYQFEWAEADVAEGDLSKAAEDGGYVMTIYDKNNPLRVGDKIRLDNTELEVACVLSDSPFSADDTPTLICSEETFTRLTGESDYSVVDVQLERGATDEDVSAIRDMAGDEYLFSDRRDTNRETTATYLAFTLLVYGFLAIIAIITVFNIMNSVSMSASARTKQYGVMRAVGMEVGQVAKMILAEAATYAISGCAVGCALGLPLNRFLFRVMVSDYWGIDWSIPVGETLIIAAIVLIAVAAAVYAPTKRIANLSIAETINEQ